MVNFGYFSGPITKRHDVFLHKQLCQPIPENLWEAAQPHGPIGGKAAVKFALIPNSEFINWLTSNGIEYLIHSVWNDGCSLFLINHTDEILTLVKLRWDNKYCRSYG